MNVSVQYLTLSETAKILRCSEKTLYNRMKAGEIRPYRNGRRVLFTNQCIQDFLNRSIGMPPTSQSDTET